MPSTTAKIAVLTPMASVSTRSAVRVTAGVERASARRSGGRTERQGAHGCSIDAGIVVARQPFGRGRREQVSQRGAPEADRTQRPAPYRDVGVLAEEREEVLTVALPELARIGTEQESEQPLAERSHHLFVGSSLRARA